MLHSSSSAQSFEHKIDKKVIGPVYSGTLATAWQEQTIHKDNDKERNS